MVRLQADAELPADGPPGQALQGGWHPPNHCTVLHKGGQYLQTWLLAAAALNSFVVLVLSPRLLVSLRFRCPPACQRFRSTCACWDYQLMFVCSRDLPALRFLCPPATGTCLSLHCLSAAVGVSHRVPQRNRGARRGGPACSIWAAVRDNRQHHCPAVLHASGSSGGRRPEGAWQAVQGAAGAEQRLW